MATGSRSMESEKGVARQRANALDRLFGKRKVAIGVIHCPALPGSPAYDGESVDVIIERAVADAKTYTGGGIDGLIIENHGDIPFSKPGDLGPETAAMMAVIADRIRHQVAVPIGINVLANAAIPAIATAKAAGAAFVRVNQWANAYVANEGLIEGEAGKAMRYRAWLRAQEVMIFADVHVKHGAHAIVADRSIAELTRDVEFFGADVVIATGERTGDPPALDEVNKIRRSTRLPITIGSGVTNDNVGALLGVADGVIIGSSLKYDGIWWNAVEQSRVEKFMEEVRRLSSAVGS